MTRAGVEVRTQFGLLFIYGVAYRRGDKLNYLALCRATPRPPTF